MREHSRQIHRLLYRDAPRRCWSLPDVRRAGGPTKLGPLGDNPRPRCARCRDDAATDFRCRAKMAPVWLGLLGQWPSCRYLLFVLGKQ